MCARCCVNSLNNGRLRTRKNTIGSISINFNIGREPWRVVRRKILSSPSFFLAPIRENPTDVPAGWFQVKHPYDGWFRDGCATSPEARHDSCHWTRVNLFALKVSGWQHCLVGAVRRFWCLLWMFSHAAGEMELLMVSTRNDDDYDDDGFDYKTWGRGERLGGAPDAMDAYQWELFFSSFTKMMNGTRVTRVFLPGVVRVYWVNLFPCKEYRDMESGIIHQTHELLEMAKSFCGGACWIFIRLGRIYLENHIVGYHSVPFGHS